MSKRKSGSVLLQAIQKTVETIGTTGDTGAPKVNDEQDKHVMEYAIAKAIYSVAEKRCEAARTAVIVSFEDALAGLETSAPAVIIHTSTFTGMTAQRVRGSFRMDKEKTIAAIARKFEIPLAEAASFVNAECGKYDKDSIRLTPALITGE